MISAQALFQHDNSHVKMPNLFCSSKLLQHLRLNRFNKLHTLTKLKWKMDWAHKRLVLAVSMMF